MPDPNPVDAVIVPQTFIPAVGNRNKIDFLDTAFGPALGTKRVHARSVPGGAVLVTADGHDNGRQITRNFATDHPLAGQDRYEWADRGDGVLYGTLKPEAKVKDV